MTMQVATAQGATTIVAGTAKDVKRLEVAQQLGADYIVNVQEKNLLDEVHAITNSRGVDIVLECSGNENAANDGLMAVKKGGRFTQIGLFSKPITIDFEKIAVKEIKTTGSFGSRWTSWEKALQLMAQGKFQLRPLVSDIFPLTEWKKAFDMFEKKQGLKIVLTPIES
jgi:L-iditol 2-dehydrogenase